MPIHNEDSVILEGGIVVWEGIKVPETTDAGKQYWELGVVFPPTCPDLALLDQLANKVLLASKWRGTMPPGGDMPIKPVAPGSYNDMFVGWHKISFKTHLRAPDIFNEAGAQLEPMTFSNILFSGQTVNVLTACYDYDNKRKGIGAGLDGFRIIESAGSQPLNFGGGVRQDAVSAFGTPGAAPAAQPAAYVAPVAQPAAAPAAYVAPAAAPAAYVAPAAAPAAYVAPVAQPAAAPAAAYAAPVAQPAAPAAYVAPVAAGNALAPAPIAGTPGAPVSATISPSEAPVQAAPATYMPAV